MALFHSAGQEVATIPDTLTSRLQSYNVSRPVVSGNNWRISSSDAHHQIRQPRLPRIISAGSKRVIIEPNIAVHPNVTTSQTQMSIATHPTNHHVVLIGSNAVRVTPFGIIGSQGWYYSTDAGEAWFGRDTLPVHADINNIILSNPTVAIDLDGTLYFNTIQIGQTSRDILTAISMDNGASWIRSVVPGRINGDKAHFAIDVNPSSPYEGYLYTAFTDFDQNFLGGNVKFSRSTNRGLTFGEAVPISDTIGRTLAQGVVLQPGADGELYAAWCGYEQLPPVNYRLGFRKSSDGGQTWQPPQVIRSVNDARGLLRKGDNFIRVNGFPSMAVDRSEGIRHGWIYIVYAERSPLIDIQMIRSTDGGTSWSEPITVPQDDSRTDHWSPWITVDPSNGRLFVVYYDSRNFESNDTSEVYLSTTSDGGETFDDFKISDEPFLPAPVPGLGGNYAGEYIGVTALNGTVWSSWNDNRTGIQQAYASQIVFEEVSGPPKISVSALSLDFGEVFIGYSRTLVLGVRNIGYPDTLRITSVSSSSPDFTSNVASFSLAGGTGRRINVTYTPTVLGSTSATLTIASSDTSRGPVEVQLMGTGVYPPHLNVAQDTMKFDLVQGSDSLAQLPIVNEGLGMLRFSITDSVTWMNVVPSNDSIFPGSSKFVTIHVGSSNLDAGVLRSFLILQSNDPLQSRVIIPVRLRIMGAPNIFVLRDTVEFGEAWIGYPDTVILGVINRGADSLHVFVVSSDNPNFTVGGPFAFAVGPRHAQHIPIWLLLHKEGVEVGTLTVISDDPGTPALRLTLHGIGVHAPVIDISLQSLSFVVHEGDSAVGNITLANNGQSQLTYSLSHVYRRFTAQQSLRPQTQAPRIEQSQSTDEEFPFPRILVVDFSSPAHLFLDSLHIPNTFTYPGGFDTMDLNNYDLLMFGESHFTDIIQPIINRSGDIEMFLREGGGVIALSEQFSAWEWLPFYIRGLNAFGNGVHVTDLGHPVTDLLSDSGLSNWGPSYSNVFSSFPADATVLAVASDADEKPIMLAGRVGYGRYVLSGLNHDSYFRGGFAEALQHIKNMVRWAAPVGWLSRNVSAGSLGPAGTNEIQIIARSRFLYPGMFKATLTATSNDPARPKLLVPIDLQVIGRPVISLLNDTLDFEQCYVGYPSTQLIAIANPGSDTLHISGITSADPRFHSNETFPVAIPPRMTGSVSVDFDASDSGIVSTIISINSDDSSHTAVPVNVSAFGVYPPIIDIVPDSLFFTIEEGDSVSSSLTVTNRGRSDLRFSLTNSYQANSSQPPVGQLLRPAFKLEAGSRMGRSTSSAISGDHSREPHLVGEQLSDSTTRILVVHVSGSTEKIIDPLHIPYVLVLSRNIDTVHFNNYDIVIIGSEFPGSDSLLLPLIRRSSDIATFISNGGGLIVLPEQSQLAWQWLPVSVRTTYGGGNIVHIVDQAHPVMDSLSDFDLSNWFPSYVNLFTSYPVSFKVLANGFDSNQKPVMIAGDYGAGRILLSGMSHERASYLGFPKAPRLVSNMIGWVAPNRWLNESIFSATIRPRDSVAISLRLNAHELHAAKYRVNIVAESNDPATPEIFVPVILWVDSARNEVPHSFVLYQNYPNPFNPRTLIEYNLPVESKMTLIVYNVLGQHVATLVDGVQSEGHYTYEWDPQSLPSGLYLCRMNAVPTKGEGNNVLETKKMLLLK